MVTRKFKPIGIKNKAADFSLPSTEGRNISLKDYRGKKVILYFYPKDMTPGCTTESCSFRDNVSALERKGAVVLGVSADSVASHEKFAKKYQLQFPLLSDESRAVLKLYGVWKEKSLYGKNFRGIERTTVVIDEEGYIAHIFPKVRVGGHVEEVLDFIDNINKKKKGK